MILTFCGLRRRILSVLFEKGDFRFGFLGDRERTMEINAGNHAKDCKWNSRVDYGATRPSENWRNCAPTS